MLGLFIGIYVVGVAVCAILAALLDMFLLRVGGDTPGSQFYDFLALVWVLVTFLVPLALGVVMMQQAERRLAKLNRVVHKKRTHKRR